MAQESKSLSVARVTCIFKEHLYSQPIFVKKMPPQRLIVTIHNEQDVEITQGESKKKVLFQPFLLQTKNKVFLLVGSTFSLYKNISRDPYLETKAEYQFQRQVKKALGLVGGYSYYLPGDSSDFVTRDLSLEDVYSRDLSLRYEHDEKYFYLFILL